ncbi:MAG: PSD1 and planctomycete cytochrome C domain-containing protein [Verrucomicrobiota bacterium]
MNLYPRFSLVAAMLLAFPLSLAAVDFERDVFPILDANCLDCHDSDTLKGGIGLDRYHYAMLPTDAGEPLFVPGEPEKSVLLHVVEETDPEKRMPPKGDPLTSTEIEILHDWIEAGAVWPDDGWRPPVHWSFVPPTRPDLPEIGKPLLSDREHNEIDHFVARKLAEAELSFNPETDPSRLLRRAHLDITGLPPSHEQIDRFLADPSPAHYERIIDELLASPAFGEKWATQWLDMARYADSEGYQRDSPRNMWPYRDWVIDALNADMPFDQFTIEQLAGDLLPNATESQLVATAFHRNSPTNLEAGTDPREDRYKVTADRTATTGTIWMGLTVGCAQCHNHKYDPITAKEYYELFAFFNNTPMESKQQGDKMGMSGLVHIGPTVKVSKRETDLEFEKVVAADYRDSFAQLESNVRKAAELTLAKRKNGRDGVDKKALQAIDSDKAMTMAQVKLVLKHVAKGKAAYNRKAAELDITANRLKAQRAKEVRVMEELETMRPTFIAKRGDFLSKGEQVGPATPASLHPFPEDYPRNRLGLAKWLVDPANPLVSRAFVNRLWIEVFGQGLVTTPEDFGTQGEMPTHPELLDWLAVTFQEEDGWSLKKSLKRILLSATYRQSISIDLVGAKADPKNQLLWRHPGHRLNAETIRDQALAISGLLSRRMHGVHSRPFQPEGVWRKTAGNSETYYINSKGEDAYRRGVYTIWRRNNHYPSFANFDAPDRGACVVKRDVSNTPLQSLTLLNDPAYVEMTRAFGQRIITEGGESLDERLDWAFRSVLARSPRDSERSLLHAAFEKVYLGPDSESEAYLEIATILFNLHETINRS